MIYEYRCTNCQRIYEAWQEMSDKHEYDCPTCGQKCIREWNHAPQVRVDDGFYTWQFSQGGEWVGSKKEYDEKLAKTRTLTGMDKYLGVNKVKDEYAEQRHNKIEADRKRAARDISETEEHIDRLQKEGRMD